MKNAISHIKEISEDFYDCIKPNNIFDRIRIILIVGNF